ncbi:hypothetical protein GCM10029963_76700 [Micromonospora andamanensis]|uniref:hypothetical protein n=1 Tax=Micromonospora andamanensis TaxID=1287068 RepID=UPI00194F3CDE|nr:hypothetical protein [Micromonospora andamanensis]GIJ42969.1 hypothetical protein Vwe01_62940 [Micromonospora andamanensis]
MKRSTKRAFIALAMALAALSPTLVHSGASHAAPSAHSAGVHDVGTQGFWGVVGWFYTLRDCTDAGEYGRRVGTWGGYECSYMPHDNQSKPWRLYAHYN